MHKLNGDKALLVVKGFHQTEGRDYINMFTLVIDDYFTASVPSQK